jgi:hypothetical protein
MRFATDEVMRGDYEMRMDAAHKGVSVAAITPNEARELLGLKRYDDPKADKLYCNSAIQELGEPGEVIRMNTAASGTTPDGIHLDPNAGPQSTPVPALQGSNGKPGKPHSIPRKPPTPVPAGGSSGGPQPGNQNPSSTRPKHFREVKAQVCRGKTPGEIRAFAKSLAERYPDELEDILESVRLAIAERDMKRDN